MPCRVSGFLLCEELFLSTDVYHTHIWPIVIGRNVRTESTQFPQAILPSFERMEERLMTFEMGHIYHRSTKIMNSLESYRIPNYQFEKRWNMSL